ncbi:hypothetical protein Q7P37_007728 [Cladosporium fusiforme]
MPATTANTRTPSPAAALITSPLDRDHAADSDDSLARKRQRLSEDPDVRIEADEPEDDDLGADMGTAIVIEDDHFVDANAYSDTFQIFNSSTPAKPFDELMCLSRLVAGDHFLDPQILHNLVVWVDQHLQDTAHDRKNWQAKYIEDEVFFTTLAEVAHQILDCGDLFDTSISSGPIGEIGFRFQNVLTMLSLRITSFIPKMLEGPLARRDSAQPAASNQQQVPLFLYLSLLGRILIEHTAFSRFLQEHFDLKFHHSVIMNFRVVLADKQIIPSLNAVLLNLSARPREFSEAWIMIAHVIYILCQALAKSGPEFHAGEGRVQVDNMFISISEYVVPAVCQKHPRALPPDFHTNLIDQVSEVLQVAVLHRPMNHVLELYQAIAKEENALPCGLVDEPVTELKLKEACCDDKTTLAVLIKNLWLLQVLKGYVSTDILDIKSKGIVSLRELLKNSHHHYSQRGNEHPILQYLARLLRIGNFTEYIFSADSHASLVKECIDVVGFLAATGTYTDHETDLIWKACATSVEAEFVRASFGVLKSMLVYVQPQQILYMARKYSQVPASSLGVYAVTFLGDAFAKFHTLPTEARMQLEPMRICFDILKRLDLDPPGPLTAQLRNAAIHEITILTRPVISTDQRKELYDMCLFEIKGRTVHATSSMETLCLFLKSLSAEESDLVLTMLPVQAAVDELVHFVRNDAKEEISPNRSVLEAVNARLSLVLYLAGLSVCKEDKSLEQTLWTHTVGDLAISSRAREDALDFFIETPKFTKHPASVETLFQRSVDQFLPTMSADCATLRLVAFLGEKAKAAEKAISQEGVDHILVDKAWQQLTRLAMTTSSENVASAGIQGITNILFPKRWSPGNDASAMARQAAFVRQHIDFLQSLQEEPNESKRQISINHGITLLETIHQRSKAVKPHIIADESPITLASSEEAERIEFTVHIHVPQSSPIARTVQALEDCHIVDLGKALQSTSGVADHDLVRNGSLTRLEDISSQTLQEAGIKASSVVSIRPRYTFDCDFGKVFASTSAVEREILARFDHLEMLLDSPDEVAERVYKFLSEVSPPMSTRQRVLASDVSLDDIFPKDRLYRTLYSIRVLTSHLGECNKLGVADQQFILHGAKMLSSLLLDNTRNLSGLVLLKCLPGLVDFLQGTGQNSKSSTRLRFADISSERPQNSPPPPYLEHPKDLGFRLLEIIEHIQQMSFPMQLPIPSQIIPLSVRAQVTRLAYSVLLQLARTDGLWPEIESSEQFVNAHRKILLNKDGSVSQALGVLMGDFLKEQRELTTGTYLNALIALMPDAMAADCSTSGFFSLFGEVIWADAHTNSNEQTIRLVVAKLTTHMWQYQHTETPDLAVMDLNLSNLLILLNITIDVLKSFKKPLQLGSLAVEIYDRLLFCAEYEAPMLETLVAEHQAPSITDLALRVRSKVSTANGILPDSTDATTAETQLIGRPPKPVYHSKTRAVCLDIVRRLCDGSDEYEWLLERVTQSVQYTKRVRGAWFPTGQHLRAPEACSGLSNLGMTCYMNSLLQQIYSNIHFRKFVFDTPVVDESKADLLWHVKRLFAQMQNLDMPWVDTQELANYLNISVDTQEDVHGFYTIFMSSLESCLPDPTTRAVFNGMFSGKLATQVQGSCGHVSSRTEPFSDLSITVQNKSSLADSLAEFVQGEPMQGANKYKCLSCEPESGGKLVDAMRRTCLEDVPDHLTVCLKRFAFDMMGQESKNNDFFAFPEEIDLSMYERKNLETAGASAQPDVFRLVGVIVHSGILTFGHYWSYVRLRHPDPRISNWVRLEDTNFRPAKGFEEVQNECFGGNNRTHNGYVLFYQRTSSFEKASAATAQTPCGAASMIRLPPRVGLPDGLFQQMHQLNVDRHRAAQLFDQSFHKFVLDITQDFHSRAPQATTTTDSSPSSETELKTEEMNVVTQTSPLCASFARLALKYIEHVVLGENMPEKLSQFLHFFHGQAVLQPKLMHCIVLEMCKDPTIFLQTLDHDNQELRKSMHGFMKDCLVHIKQHDRENYFDDLHSFIRAHSAQLDTIEDRQFRWADFFGLALEIAQLGALEADPILKAGYCSWILDSALCVAFEPTKFSRLPVMREQAKKRRVVYAPLLQFLAVFLQRINAFDDIDAFARGNKFDMLRLLVTSRPHSPLRWMELALDQNVEPYDVKSFPACQLIQAMVSAPDASFQKIIAESLICVLRADRPYYDPVFYMVAAFVESSGDTKNSLRILNEIAKGLAEHDRLPMKLMFDFFNTVMGQTPFATTHAIQFWAADWLLPRYRASKRTQAWLVEHLFEKSPLNRAVENQDIYGTTIDVIRSTAVRNLSAKCANYLKEAEVGEESSYTQMRAVLDHARRYLVNLVSICDRINHAALNKHAETTEQRDETAAESAKEQADQQAEAEPNGPRLTPAMFGEHKHATRAANELSMLLVEYWDDDTAEQIEEEVESSVFDDTDDDEL